MRSSGSSEAPFRMSALTRLLRQILGWPQNTTRAPTCNLVGSTLGEKAGGFLSMWVVEPVEPYCAWRPAARLVFSSSASSQQKTCDGGEDQGLYKRRILDGRF